MGTLKKLGQWFGFIKKDKIPLHEKTVFNSTPRAVLPAVKETKVVNKKTKPIQYVVPSIAVCRKMYRNRHGLTND